MNSINEQNSLNEEQYKLLPSVIQKVLRSISGVSLSVMVLVLSFSGLAHAGQSYRAISLSVLQERLSAGSSDRDLRYLAGITRISGVVIDTEANDIILIGRVARDAPALHLEDLVVALRNAWMKYAHREGTTINYSYPGCSIDPYERSTAKLYTIGRQFSRSSSGEDMERVIEKWNRECATPQNVRVLGIPHNSRFARILVEADYDMKRFVDGSNDETIPGLRSLTAMQLDTIKKSFEQGKEYRLGMMMNRFWFYPGELELTREEQTTFIGHCPVILLTENEFITRTGSRSGTGQADPLAAHFAQNFSDRFQVITRKKPLYQELENMFRFVALAQVLQGFFGYNRVPEQLTWLINTYELAPVSVVEELPGLSFCARETFERAVPDGVEKMSVKIPVCGGVNIRMKIDTKDIKKRRPQGKKSFEKEMKNKKPSEKALYWDFTV